MGPGAPARFRRRLGSLGRRFPLGDPARRSRHLVLEPRGVRARRPPDARHSLPVRADVDGRSRRAHTPARTARLERRGGAVRSRPRGGDRGRPLLPAVSFAPRALDRVRHPREHGLLDSGRGFAAVSVRSRRLDRFSLRDRGADDFSGRPAAPLHVPRGSVLRSFRRLRLSHETGDRSGGGHGGGRGLVRRLPPGERRQARPRRRRRVSRNGRGRVRRRLPGSSVPRDGPRERAVAVCRDAGTRTAATSASDCP